MLFRSDGFVAQGNVDDLAGTACLRLLLAGCLGRLFLARTGRRIFLARCIGDAFAACGSSLVGAACGSGRVAGFRAGCLVRVVVRCRGTVIAGVQRKYRCHAENGGDGALFGERNDCAVLDFLFFDFHFSTICLKLLYPSSRRW